MSFDNSTVGGNDVTVLNQNDISRDDLVDWDGLCLGTTVVVGSSNNGSLGGTD